MARIDTNIFKDMSTSHQNLPNEQSFRHDSAFSNLKVIRLKSAASWMDYVVMESHVSDTLKK